MGTGNKEEERLQQRGPLRGAVRDALLTERALGLGPAGAKEAEDSRSPWTEQHRLDRRALRCGGSTPTRSLDMGRSSESLRWATGSPEIIRRKGLGEPCTVSPSRESHTDHLAANSARPHRESGQ